MITGYYEPLLQGSWEQSEEYPYPLYGVPEDLLVVDLGAVYPQLKGMRLRGKLVGNKVVPYHDRAQLDDDQELLQGAEILWVNSSVDLFFLHVQGSGLVELADGSIAAVGYAGIADLDHALALVEAGATRLGTSRGVALAQALRS